MRQGVFKSIPGATGDRLSPIASSLLPARFLFPGSRDFPSCRGQMKRAFPALFPQRRGVVPARTNNFLSRAGISGVGVPSQKQRTHIKIESVKPLSLFPPSPPSHKPLRESKESSYTLSPSAVLRLWPREMEAGFCFFYFFASDVPPFWGSTCAGWFGNIKARFSKVQVLALCIRLVIGVSTGCRIN